MFIRQRSRGQPCLYLYNCVASSMCARTNCVASSMCARTNCVASSMCARNNCVASSMCARNNCVASSMCTWKANVMAPHPNPPPHPTKPLRAFAESKNLRGVQAKMLYVENLTGSPVTPPPEKRDILKGNHRIFQPSIFRGDFFRFPGKCIPPNGKTNETHHRLDFKR